ncbi:MAG: right-handed parallel beta-helix repeat-containing protein [Myxococcota bacterium]
MRALALVLLLLVGAVPAAAATRVVGSGESIQAAVDAAEPGDTVLVRPGSYAGPGGVALVHVRKSGLILRATRSALLDARGYRYGVLVGDERAVGADACKPPTVRGFALEGFTIRGAGQAGLHLAGVDGFALRDGVYLDNARHGVFPLCAAHGQIAENFAAGHGDAAIAVVGSSHVVVEDNSVTRSAIGIAIENSSHALVRKNQLFGNSAGLLIAVLAGRPLPLTDRVRIEENSIIENNHGGRPAPSADAGVGAIASAAGIPTGAGILNAGGDHVSIERNVVLGNDSFGVAAFASPDARQDPRSDPFVDAQSVQRNVILLNGHDPDPLRASTPGADIVFVPDRIDFANGRLVELDPDSSDNCYGDNRYFTDSPMEVTGSLACP